MSYYNPEVYDPKKLLGEDAAVMEWFSLCGQMVLDRLDEMEDNGLMDESIPLFSELYRQVAHDIKGRIANLLDCEKIELTVSLMEAEPERYAAD